MNAYSRANRRIYAALSDPLSATHRHRLDDLLKRHDNGKTTWLAWLRQSPVKPNSRHILEHIERLKAWQALDLPSGIERSVHQNRLLKIAREGGQMTPADLAKFEAQRRYATLVRSPSEGMATVTDEIIDLHDRILGKLFNAAKHKHQQQFQASGKAINAKVRLATSIKQGTVTASLMLRKLGSYPRQNGLAVALRELGRIERTLFILDWLQSVELRRRVHCRTEQGRSPQRASPRRVLQPAGRNPRPQFRAAALPGQRPQPGDGGHSVVEHGLSGTGLKRLTRSRPDCR